MAQIKKNYANVCKYASLFCRRENDLMLADYFEQQRQKFKLLNYVTQYTARELIATKRKEARYAGLFKTKCTLYSVQHKQGVEYKTVFSSTYEREAVKELRTRRELAPHTAWRIEKTRTQQIKRSQNHE